AGGAVSIAGIIAAAVLPLLKTNKFPYFCGLGNHVKTMVSDRFKKIFLAICIIIPFLLYCFYYYSMMFKNAPYRFTDFESIILRYGEGDSLVNRFDSRTGIYRYLNSSDSLVTDTVRLRKDD